jgi:hypothetical protein
MKNKPETHDTVITIRHQNIQQCSSKGFCKNHPDKHLLIHTQDPETNLCLDSSRIDTAIVQANKETFQAITKGEVKHEKEVVLTAFDTIKPCDNTFLQKGDTRLASEIISIPEIKNQEPVQANLDLECLSLTFGFMIYLSLKYAVNSYSAWSSMFSEIKSIVNS